MGTQSRQNTCCVRAFAKSGYDVARLCHVDGILDGLTSVRHDLAAASIRKLKHAKLYGAADFVEIFRTRVFGCDHGEVRQLSADAPHQSALCAVAAGG